MYLLLEVGVLLEGVDHGLDVSQRARRRGCLVLLRLGFARELCSRLMARIVARTCGVRVRVRVGVRVRVRVRVRIRVRVRVRVRVG